jgi:phosphatidylserine decarboxylase
MNNGIKKIALFLVLLIVSDWSLVYFNGFSYAHSHQNQKKNSKSMKNITKNTPLSLRFLYRTSLGTIIRYGLTKPWFSSLAGFYCNQSMSKYHIKSFIKENNINISEAQEPVDSFKTFNDFFIRKLKPEARPINQNPEIIIAPADGNVMIFENSTQKMRFPIKQSNFNLEQFLGNKELAKSFESGTIMIFRLAPWDYHRFHFPTDCIPSKPQIIHGNYESVNPIVYYTGIQPLTENERHLYVLKTEDCDDISMVSVGALCVGKIKETYIPLQNYIKGDEAGYFCFGGSTLVLLFKQGTIEVSKEILNNSKQGIETPIKMGDVIAKVTTS